MLPQCDTVLIACGLGPETRGLIDARRLALFKPGALLINVARAAIVDEDALYDALKRRRSDNWDYGHGTESSPPDARYGATLEVCWGMSHIMASPTLNGDTSLLLSDETTSAVSLAVGFAA